LGGDSAAPERPAKINISGRWEGLLEGNSVNVTVIHDTVYGGVSGAGYMSGESFETVFDADGVVADSLVSIQFAFSGNTVFNLSGTVRGRKIGGKVNGSGYSDTPLTLDKQ
jgi:hypothetical protein